MHVIQAQEAKQLRDENTQLRELVADLSLHGDGSLSTAALPGRSLGAPPLIGRFNR